MVWQTPVAVNPIARGKDLQSTSICIMGLAVFVHTCAQQVHTRSIILGAVVYLLWGCLCNCKRGGLFECNASFTAKFLQNFPQESTKASQMQLVQVQESKVDRWTLPRGSPDAPKTLQTRSDSQIWVPQKFKECVNCVSFGDSS